MSKENDKSDIEKFLLRMKHSNVALYKAIIAVLTQVLQNNSSDEAFNVACKFKQVVTNLTEVSRRWAISKHFVYDVCRSEEVV